MSYGNLAIWCAQIALLAAVAAAVAALFRLRPAPARLLYWQVLLAACLALPLIEPWQRETVVVTPSVELAAPVAAMPASPAPAPTPRRIPWPDAVLWVLGAGVAFRLGRFALGLARLRRYRRTARPLDPLPEPVDRARRELGVFPEMALSAEVSGPVTFGFADPVILFPARFLEWDPAHQAAVACHELLHVRRRDWLFTAIEEVVRAVFWFHPAVWWVLGQIQLSREQSVDREVVRLSVARERYVDALLAVSGARSQFDLAPAPLFLRRRQLTARVAAILKEAEMSYRRLLLSAAACAGCVLLAGWLVCGALPMKAAPQVVMDAPGVKVTGAERIMHRNPVEYPAEARAKGIEGTVILDVVLAPDGTVQDAAVLSGPEELRNAALASVKGWHFMRDAAPRQQVTLEYKLSFAAEPAAQVTVAAPPPPPPPPPGAGPGGPNVMYKVAPVTPSGGPGGANVMYGAVGPAGPMVSVRHLKEPAVLQHLIFRGLSPEATAELRRRLPFQEGQVVDNEALANANRVIHAFNPNVTITLASILPATRNADGSMQPQSGLTLMISPMGVFAGGFSGDIPRKVLGLEISGLSPEPAAELRQRLAIREGVTLDREAFMAELKRVSAGRETVRPASHRASEQRQPVRISDSTARITPPDMLELTFRVAPEGYPGVVARRRRCRRPRLA